MVNFHQWLETKGYKLDEQPGKEPSTNEGSTKRAAVRSHAYPPAYGRGQYTKGYFTPTAADTLVYDKDQ